MSWIKQRRTGWGGGGRGRSIRVRYRTKRLPALNVSPSRTRALTRTPPRQRRRHILRGGEQGRATTATQDNSWAATSERLRHSAAHLTRLCPRKRGKKERKPMYLPHMAGTPWLEKPRASVVKQGTAPVRMSTPCRGRQRKSQKSGCPPFGSRPALAFEMEGVEPEE